MNSQERFIAACANRKVDRPPVWIMRQAGRALPEYLAVREKNSFWEICTTPELAALVSLQPVRRFKMDACIIFSDILVVPFALGMKVDFSSGVALSPAIATKKDIDKLQKPDVPKSLGFVPQIIRNVRAELGDETAVLGFSGAPFTLACYMVEGGNSRSFTKTKTMIYREPILFAKLLSKIADAVGDYLVMQAEAGVTAVQLFDTWAGELAPADYERLVLPSVQKIIRRLKPKKVPVIYYINGIGNLLDPAGRSGADVLGIDWRIDLAQARKRLGARQVLQGNLDPHMLLGPEKLIRQRVFTLLDQTRGKGHIVNLGHGLLPETPLNAIATFIQSVREWAEAKR